MEARFVTETVRRITALLLVEPALDANYAAVKAETYEWGSSTWLSGERQPSAGIVTSAST